MSSQSSGAVMAEDVGGDAAGGAAVGAAVGSAFPGIGTAIGAGVGAGVGALTGLVQSQIPDFNAEYPQVPIPSVSSVTESQYLLPNMGQLQNDTTAAGAVQFNPDANGWTQGAFNTGGNALSQAMAGMQSIYEGNAPSAANIQFQQKLSDYLNSGPVASNNANFGMNAVGQITGNLATQAGQQQMATDAAAMQGYDQANQALFTDNYNRNALFQQAINDTNSQQNGLQAVSNNIALANAQGANQYNSDVEKYNNQLLTSTLARSNYLNTNLANFGQSLMQAGSTGAQIGSQLLSNSGTPTAPGGASAAVGNNGIVAGGTDGLGGSYGGTVDSGLSNATFGGTGDSAGYSMGAGTSTADAAATADMAGADAVVTDTGAADSSMFAAMVFP